MNTKPPQVVLLIDADNVSIDVIEQAVEHLLDAHGALHVRRAYGTAESAVKHQAVFKRLGIRPMVNLATGKNSTDIALAVDAMDLAIAERPDVVAIASSDSDFAPLVARLREKGCRVVGLGQAGKTGDETVAVYDAFTVLTHRKAGAPSKKTAAPAAPAAPRKAAARKTTPRNTTPRKAAPRKTEPRKAAAAPADDPLARVHAALPELADGRTVELRLAAERLREAGLIGRNGSSTRVFGAHPDHFELLPAKNPNQVRLRR